MAHFVIPGDPVGKPRMTRRDQWKQPQRPSVAKYRAYADWLRLHVGNVECSGRVSWIAYFEMPASWSKRKKQELQGEPHQQTPDRDNIDKAILDALFDRDEFVFSGELAKFWDDGRGARLELTIE